MSYPSILQQPQGLACLGFISSTIPLRPPGLRKGLERLKGRSSSMDDSRILVGRSWGISRCIQTYTLPGPPYWEEPRAECPPQPKAKEAQQHSAGSSH